MKRKYRVYSLLIVMIMIAGLVAGCGQKEQPSNADANANANTQVKRVSLATGGTAGTYYPIGAAITAVITKYVPGVEATAESTGASVANLKMIQEKNVDFIMSASNTALGGFQGEDPFEKPISNIRGITALYPETFQFIVLDKSNLKTLTDLKGKKVAVGAAGSGTERTAKILLEAHGLTYNDIKPEFLNFGEAVTALKDRLIDCAIVGSGIPTAAVVDASATLDIDLLTVDEAITKDILKEITYLQFVTIPEGTYKGVDRDILTVASPALLITHEEMDENTVYEITKAIFANLPEVQSAHALGKNITLENALNGMSLPLHPGAEKFYKEKGIIK